VDLSVTRQHDQPHIIITTIVPVHSYDASEDRMRTASTNGPKPMGDVGFDENSACMTMMTTTTTTMKASQSSLVPM
jgi:hypothetical protein